MKININKIVDIYSQKLANSERENVLLQVQVSAYEEAVKEKDYKIKELEHQLNENNKDNEDNK